MNFDELNEMKDKLINIMEETEINCLCGNILTGSDLDFYKYPNSSDDYWLFAHCSKCDYDLNYQKILHQKIRKEYKK